MSRIAVALFVLVAFALPVHAESARAWLRCDAQAGALVVHYHPADASEAYAGAFDRVVEFGELLDLDENQTSIVGTREETFECRLGDDVLAVVLSPMPGNANLLGSCGGDIGGMVAVSRNGVPVADDFVFERGECHEREDYAAKLVLRAHANAFEVERRRYDPDD